MPQRLPATKAMQKILANLDRVEPLPYKLYIDQPRRRHQFEGVECTHQISSLIVNGFVRLEADGRLLRTEPKPAFPLNAGSET